jgi:hypothetical protein
MAAEEPIRGSYEAALFCGALAVSSAFPEVVFS